MKTLNVKQMEQIEGGSFWSWALAGVTCAVGAAATVATYGAVGEMAAVACGAAIVSA
jgi:bacteriocin-like protein